jgi:hypothetical protein
MRAKEKPSVTITFAVFLLAPELDVTIAKSISGIIQQKVLLDHYRACGQEANDSSATSIRETINSRVIPTLRSKMAALDIIDV